jgi:hypothetical protein
VWIARTESVRNGHRVRIRQDGETVTFRSYLQLLAEDRDFALWYSELLGGADYEAFFWEHPPICHDNIDADAEFVLLDSPALARLDPDPTAFGPYFVRGREIVSFRSLGGDAVLIVPVPTEPLAACTHLASFVRESPTSVVLRLWRMVGETAGEMLSDRNLWLSTSGLGVSWLHIRLDSLPKYYQHLPYREISGVFGLR